MSEHALAVFADAVGDLGRWDSVAVLQLEIEGNGVVRLWKVLTEDDQAYGAIELPAEGAVVVLADRNGAALEPAQGGQNRSHAAIGLKHITANEISFRIGLIELVAPKPVMRTVMAVLRLVERARDQGAWVEHQVFADKAA